MTLPLALQIRAARLAAGLSQHGLERAIGAAETGSVSRYESGHRTPSLDTLRRIAAATGATFEIDPGEATS
jgi:transcriptional regulator with XRE-family HTH domain